MVITSNDQLACITSDCANYSYCYTLLMLTISALRDYMYEVYISVTCRFQFLYSVISNCHTIRISYKETQKVNYYFLELVLFKIPNLCNPT